MNILCWMWIQTDHNYICKSRSYGYCIGSHYVVQVFLLYGLQLGLVKVWNDVINTFSVSALHLFQKYVENSELNLDQSHSLMIFLCFMAFNIVYAQEGAKDLDRRKLLSVSMNGPNVNWKFLELLQQEQAEQYGGAQLIVVGSCGLHTLHNACKGGFVVWQLDKVLRAMHTLFHNTPARREDLTVLTKMTTFPMPFCGHRRLENLPAVERALEVWPSVTMYMDALKTKRLPNPGTSSFDTLGAAQNDPVIMAKLHFYLSVIRTFSPFLTTYQTDQPMMPFPVNNLAELMKVIKDI